MVKVMIVKKYILILSWILIIISGSCKTEITHPDKSSEGNGERLEGKKLYLSEYKPMNADGTVNAVIEIPAGTHEKWEVDKTDERMHLQYIDNIPRIIQYLSYPANYGMIPQSILPKDKGGDGDALDIIVLGEHLERGSVVKTKIIGMLRLIDGGEQDDKLIAVPMTGVFSEISNIIELKDKYSGVAEIIELWYSNYKGPGILQTKGYADRDSALTVLQYAVDSYQNNIVK